MPLFRATVYTLSSAVEAIEGDAGISRTVIEAEAENAGRFEAEIRDRYIHDVDAMVDFGPVSNISKDGRWGQRFRSR
jgi:hypothetical protein